MVITGSESLGSFAARLMARELDMLILHMRQQQVPRSRCLVCRFAALGKQRGWSDGVVMQHWCETRE